MIFHGGYGQENIIKMQITENRIFQDIIYGMFCVLCAIPCTIWIMGDHWMLLAYGIFTYIIGTLMFILDTTVLS